MSVRFCTDFTLLGIGAPIHIFLPDVAKALGTTAVIPDHSQVANALGAIVGNVVATHSVAIRPNVCAAGVTGYTVYGNSENRVFEALEEAEEFAVSEAKGGAYAEAINRGAQGQITVMHDLNRDAAQARDGMVYLGTTAVAHAVGAIGW
jgi:hypothetical protein